MLVVVLVLSEMLGVVVMEVMISLDDDVTKLLELIHIEAFPVVTVVVLLAVGPSLDREMLFREEVTLKLDSKTEDKGTVAVVVDKVESELPPVVEADVAVVETARLVDEITQSPQP